MTNTQRVPVQLAAASLVISSAVSVSKALIFNYINSETVRLRQPNPSTSPDSCGSGPINPVSFSSVSFETASILRLGETNE